MPQPQLMLLRQLCGSSGQLSLQRGASMHAHRSAPASAPTSHDEWNYVDFLTKWIDASKVAFSVAYLTNAAARLEKDGSTN